MPGGRLFSTTAEIWQSTVLKRLHSPPCDLLALSPLCLLQTLAGDGLHLHSLTAAVRVQLQARLSKKQQLLVSLEQAPELMAATLKGP
jgi:hypothetical protein